MINRSPIPLWAVLCVGVVLLGGIYLFAKNTGISPEASVVVTRPTQTTRTSGSSIATVSPVPAPSTGTSTPAQANDWKTYRNTAYGFEFLYPPVCNVEEQESGGTVGLLSADTYLTELLVVDPTRYETQGGFSQLIDVYRKAPADSLGAWFDKTIDFQGQLNHTIVNGYEALDVRGGPSDGLGVLNAVFLVNKDLIIELDRSGSFVTDEPTLAQERLIESFHFVN